MKKFVKFLLLLTLGFGCSEPEEPLQFEEKSVEINESVTVEVNYPFYIGDSDRANAINSELQNVIANSMNPMDTLKNVSVEEAAKLFKMSFDQFKKDFNDTNQRWEAFIDAEETYRSPEVLSIGINSYVDTGGAHGNTFINILNFNPIDGSVYQKEDLLIVNEGLEKIVKQYFLDAIQKKTIKSDLKDYFFGEDFHLPENIGYSDEGVIFLYNTYEASAYHLGITEFEIPFNEISEYLKVQ
ncbi:PdaC/SigV domain-containing protein [Aegicerativicinus sediminis]